MRILTLGAASILLAFSGAIQAEPSNLWHINGTISGRAVVLDCHLEQVGGNCTGNRPGGKALPLASLTESGNQLAWSMKLRFAIMKITLAFNGRVAGDMMSGTMTAAGRSGTFTAVRR